MPTPTNPYWEDYNKIVFEKLQSEAAKFQTDATAQDKYAAGLQKKIKDTVTKIVRTHIELGQTRRASAEEVLASAMSSLDEVDRLRFVLTNMLEALKRGDQLSTIIDRYNASGLTEIEVVEAGMPQVQVAGAAPPP